MRKILIFLVLITLLTMAQECGQGQTTTMKENPFKGGTRGLSIQFSEGAPPDEVFDSGSYPFDVEIKLLNVGEADIPGDSVKVQLSGINPVDFGKSESDFILNGIDEDIMATQVDSEGNEIPAPPVFVSFTDLVFQDTLPGNNQFPVRADVCYSYKTETFADGCIRADVLSVDQDAVCQISGAKKVFNSGAPIQVAEFSEQPSGSDKVRYIFKIQHQGSGRFYLPGSRCPSDLQTARTTEDRVHFNIESNVQDLVCSGLRSGSGQSGDVLLVDGEATIHCTQQTQSNLDFIDKVRITLTYDYKEFIEQPLLVKKTLI